MVNALSMFLAGTAFKPFMRLSENLEGKKSYRKEDANQLRKLKNFKAIILLTWRPHRIKRTRARYRTTFFFFSAKSPKENGLKTVMKMFPPKVDFSDDDKTYLLLLLHDSRAVLQ